MADYGPVCAAASFGPFENPCSKSHTRNGSSPVESVAIEQSLQQTDLQRKFQRKKIKRGNFMMTALLETVFFKNIFYRKQNK